MLIESESGVAELQETAEAAAQSVLVLLPGLDGTDAFFAPLIKLLPAHVRPLALTYPDHGPYRYEELLPRIRASLSGVGSCYVYASSFSGPLAVMLAAAEPQKVRGLILGATFVRAPRRYPGLFRLVASTPIVSALRLLRRLPVWLLRRRSDALREAKRETWVTTSARSLAARARSVLVVDVRKQLSQCKQPVLAIAFADDTVIARAYVEEIVSCSTSAKLVTVPGGHMGLFTHAAGLAAEVVRFIEQSSSAIVPSQ
jgi:pimeloyl-ACP methyl ester carboxylesterase